MHGKRISRSSRFCFLNGDAGVCSDIAVTRALDEPRASGQQAAGFPLCRGEARARSL